MRQPRAALCLFISILSLGADEVRFAIIGDFGVDDASELAVANLVKTNLQPKFIVTVGDNNYLGAANIDRAIGQYYHDFIGNYMGSYGAGAVSNRFFPALGNHDYDAVTGFAAHTNYFTLPGNERYYEFVRGPLHFFIVNSDTHEPDGATIDSPQAQWLSNRLAASTSLWRVVIAQDPPYSSADSILRMRWPFAPWGASVVVSGDAHHYERIMLDGFPYIVNGAGGASLAAFGTPIPGSTVRYNSNHGAMKMTATETNLTYEFWSVANGGTLIDRFTQLVHPCLVIDLTNNAVRLSWPTNTSSGFVLQSATALMNTWTNVAQTPAVSGNRYTVILARDAPRRFFRLRR
jgi:tartrate-resistant acid phosphatase type 5